MDLLKTLDHFGMFVARNPVLAITVLSVIISVILPLIIASALALLVLTAHMVGVLSMTETPSAVFVDLLVGAYLAMLLVHSGVAGTIMFAYSGILDLQIQREEYGGVQTATTSSEIRSPAAFSQNKERQDNLFFFDDTHEFPTAEYPLKRVQYLLETENLNDNE